MVWLTKNSKYLENVLVTRTLRAGASFNESRYWKKKELPNGLNFKQAVLRDQIGASRTGLEKVVNDVKDILYNVGLYDNTPEIESKESTEQRPNDWVFVYELGGSRFESNCSHLHFRFGVCFEQGVPWHSANYRMWIHSETRTWHGKDLRSSAPYR